MDDRELDLERLRFLKDGVIAEYQARLALWHVILGGAATAIGIAVGAAFSGTVPVEGAAGVGMGAAGVALVSMRWKRRWQDDFEALLSGLVKQIERLKRGGRPS